MMPALAVMGPPCVALLRYVLREIPGRERGRMASCCQTGFPGVNEKECNMCDYFSDVPGKPEGRVHFMYASLTPVWCHRPSLRARDESAPRCPPRRPWLVTSVAR